MSSCQSIMHRPKRNYQYKSTYASSDLQAGCLALNVPNQLTRQVYTVKEAVEKGIEENGDVDDSLADAHFAELGNGESLLLG
jgi:hypothetical protein